MSAADNFKRFVVVNEIFIIWSFLLFEQLVVQKGANIKEVPYRCEFGKSVILLNKLYYNNILSVKDSKGINIQGIPNSKVDDKFVNIIMKICNNEDINNKDILELTDKDAICFNR